MYVLTLGRVLHAFIYKRERNYRLLEKKRSTITYKFKILIIELSGCWPASLIAIHVCFCLLEYNIIIFWGLTYKLKLLGEMVP